MKKKYPAAITYMDVKKRIDELRANLGIKPEPRNYDKKLAQPLSDEFMSKHSPKEAVTSILSKSIDKVRSEYQHRLDKAFEMYLSSSRTLHPDIIANELGISSASFRSALIRANCMCPGHSKRKEIANKTKMTMGRSRYLFQQI